MRVDQAFRKAGFEIVNAVKAADHIIFDVRIPLEGQVPGRWKEVLANILPFAEKVAANPQAKWELEISKRYFSRGGVLRYLWRVTMRGNLATCQQMLVASVINSLRAGNEVTEVRLVGQANLMPDPANGRYKGAYRDDALASQVVAQAFSFGGTSG